MAGFSPFFSGFLSPAGPFNFKRRGLTDCMGKGDGERGEQAKGGGGREKEAIATAERLNDAFQEVHSSLSNRQLQNELAYLFSLL